MRRISGAWLLSATITATLLFLAACTSPNDAGKEVLPQDDNITGHYVDTFSIEMRTIKVDSTQSYMLSSCLFGNYYDEQFGHIHAESYVSPRVIGSNLTFGTDVTKLSLDSLVLTLDLVDFYGRYNDPIPLEIFEITQAFPTDSSLYSRSKLTADTTVDLADGYQLDFSSQPGFFDQVRIKLNDSLGRKLLFADPAKLISNTEFTDFFKGLLIRSKPVSQTNSREPGGIFAFDPRSEKSFMTIYYKDSTLGTETKNYTFAINANSQRFHSIYRTSTGPILNQALLDNGTNPSPVYGCIEAGALVNLYIGIPSIMSLDPAIINRATLVLHVDPAYEGSIDRFEPPSDVFLLVSDPTKSKPLHSAVVNSTVSFASTAREYRIPMTNTIQQILKGTLPNDGFIIIPGENGVSLNRAVIAGPGHPTLAPRLEVIYTTVPRH